MRERKEVEVVFNTYFHWVTKIVLDIKEEK